MRSMMNYHQSHFQNSINLPIDKCGDDFFINWDPKTILSTKIRNKTKKELFEQRRRSYIYIIASTNDITFYADKFPKVFNLEALLNYVDKYKDDSSCMQNLVSIRRALLLYKALKNERIREVSICINGFNTFKQRYPYFCKFKTSFLYPRK